MFKVPGDDDREFEDDERATNAPLLDRNGRAGSLDELDELERTEGMHDGALVKAAKGTLMDGIANVREAGWHPFNPVFTTLGDLTIDGQFNNGCRYRRVRLTGCHQRE